jgi:hypothetical protein
MKTAYTLTDADGDTASGQMAIHMVGHTAPSITASSATVSEEELLNGNADTLGVTDTTNLTLFSGSMSITGTGTLSIGLYPPSNVVTSGGTPLSWNGIGTKTLIGSSGSSEVLRITMQDDGTYQLKLSGAVDHGTSGVEDVLSLGFGVTVNDGVVSSSAVLNVSIEDDSPFTSNASQAFTIGQQDTNLMIILDISGSMTDNNGTRGIQASDVNRLAAAKTAITNLINTYDGYGDVAVKIVTFSTLAQDTADVGTAKDALSIVDTLCWWIYQL